MDPGQAHPVPADEVERLSELESYDLLERMPDAIYDEIVLLVSEICDTSMAAITVIDEDSQWFMAKRGLEEEQTAREHSFCTHAIVDPHETLIVQDATKDDRFRDNPYVRDDPHIRFYAGAPLVTPDGRGLGTLCAIDDEPRTLAEDQRRALEALSTLVMKSLELRRRTKELRATNQELDRFAVEALTGLKDPLSQVVSNLDLLDVGPGDTVTEEDAEFIDEARQGGEQLSDLVNELRGYAHARDRPVEIEPVDMDAVVDEVEDRLEAQIEATEARLTREDLPTIQADRSLISTCLENLVENALLHRETKGADIHVGFEAAGEAWRFLVEDDGIGIPEDEQDRIFEVFRRASNTPDRSGSRLGLAVCKRIVGRHGGQIGVESTLGEGATFWFTLPAAQGKA